MATMIAIEEVEHRRIKREKETGKQTFERLQLTKLEFDFLKGQLGPKAKFLKEDTYIQIMDKTEAQPHLSPWE